MMLPATGHLHCLQMIVIKHMVVLLTPACDASSCHVRHTHVMHVGHLHVIHLLIMNFLKPKD